MMDRASRVLFGCLLTVLAACHHAGTGEGVLAHAQLQATSERVAIAWQSGFDAGTGEMRAVLASGDVFLGSFAQVRAVVETDTTGYHVVGWSRPKWAEDPWYGGPPREAVGVNTASVVALLKSVRGSWMRCRFQLHDVDAGMAGGASGQCALSDGSTIPSVEVR